MLCPSREPPEITAVAGVFVSASASFCEMAPSKAPIMTEQSTQISLTSIGLPAPKNAAEPMKLAGMQLRIGIAETVHNNHPKTPRRRESNSR
jgi:hypothetical protein